MKFSIIQYGKRYKVQVFDEESYTYKDIGNKNGYSTIEYAKALCYKYEKGEVK